MGNRHLRILMLLWMVFWFGAFVPGHQRGMIRADEGGSAPFGVMALGACGSFVCAGRGDGSASDDPDSVPTPTPGSDCGVCEVVAKLDVPQPFIVRLDLAALADSPFMAIRSLLDGREAHAHFLGRAPPLG